MRLAIVLAGSIVLSTASFAGPVRVVAWGDSLTEGVGGTPWPTQFSNLTGLTTLNKGVGGQSSTQIANRFLAAPDLFGDFTVIWAGRNNYYDPATVVSDIATMVSHLSTTRYLILGIDNGRFGTYEAAGQPGYNFIAGINSNLAATYGSHYVDIRSILVNAYDRNVPQDVIDFREDIVPSSLRVEGVHLNTAGYGIVALAVYRGYQQQTASAGEIGAALSDSGSSLMSPFLDVIADHAASGRLNGAHLGMWGDGIWMSGFGGTGHLSGDDDQTHSLRSNFGGIAAGADWRPSPGLLLGLAFSAGRADFHLAGDPSSGKINALQLGIYSFIRLDPSVYGSFAAAVAWNRVKTNRVDTVLNTSAFEARYSSKIFGGRFEAGSVFGWITPFVAVQDIYSDLPAYGETGSSGPVDFALHYESRSLNTARTELGLRNSIDFFWAPHLATNATLHLWDRLAWGHAIGNNTQAMAAFASTPDYGFAPAHATAGRDTALADVGADIKIGKQVGISLVINTALTPRAQTYAGNISLKYGW